MEISADTFNKFALGAVAIVSMIVGPVLQWRIALRQAKLQEEVAVRQAALQEAIAKRQVADSIATRRQAWIDGLRSDVASLVTTYAEIFNLHRMEVNPSRVLEDPSQENARLHELWRRSEEIMVKAVETSARIRLRLNPTEGDHQRLNELMGAVRLLVDRTYRAEHMDSAMNEWTVKRQEILEITGTVLKAEWERVKRGDV